jgi:uncharacterized protein (DUF2267 family)
MTYRELVSRVKQYSGFSERESEQSLRIVIETIALRLDEGEREDFADQLPHELQSVTMNVGDESETFMREDFYAELEDIEGVNKGYVKEQLLAVWQALKDSLSAGEIKHLRDQLPQDMASELY